MLLQININLIKKILIKMAAARMLTGDEGIVIKTRHLKLYKCDSVVQAGSAIITTCITMGVKRSWMGRHFCTV